MTKQELLKADIEDCYNYLMDAYEPTNHCIETTMSKCAFYQETYGEDKEVKSMAINIYNKFYR